MKEKLPTDSILAQRICSAEEVLKYAIDHCLPVVQYVETYQGNSRHYNWGELHHTPLFREESLRFKSFVLLGCSGQKKNVGGCIK